MSVMLRNIRLAAFPVGVFSARAVSIQRVPTSAFRDEAGALALRGGERREVAAIRYRT